MIKLKTLLEASISTLRGSSIQRYKNVVGKRVGNQLYVHRKYAAEVIPHGVLKNAAEILKKISPNFRFASVMWDMKTNIIRFDEAPDFDTAREPHVGKYVVVYTDGQTREGQSNNIWHHKWLWVKDDYTGFDVEQSKAWSRTWLSKLQVPAKGTDKSFGDQLKTAGIQDSKKPVSNKQDITQTPEFKQWFGNSKVVDTHGNPLRVYHGTSAVFSEFDPSKAKRRFDSGRYGLDVSYFSTQKSTASRYADREHGIVYPVYLSIKHPFVIKRGEDFYSTFKREFGYSPNVNDLSAAIYTLKRSYDGIYEPYARYWNGTRPTWATFHPTQIKSAIGNAGTFDPTDPDITKEESSEKITYEQYLVETVGHSSSDIIVGTSGIREPEIIASEKFEVHGYIYQAAPMTADKSRFADWRYSKPRETLYWWDENVPDACRKRTVKYLTDLGYTVRHEKSLAGTGSADDLYKQAHGREGKMKLKELLMTEASKDKAALEWLKHMVQSGPFRGKVFLAGGAVRDMEMGQDPKDLDVVVVGAGLNGGIDFTTWLAQQMGNYKEGSNPVTYPTFGTAKIVLVGKFNGVDLTGMDVEAVASRKEQYTKGSRKPEVAPGTLEDDVLRRDFSVNSLVMDLTTGEILDLTGKGKSDIKQGIIRTTSDPDTIFGQDALRMFRAIRFATKYNWQLAPELIDGIKKNLNNLGNTSRERIRDELNKILITGNPRRGFELLRDTGLLPYVAPEFQAAVGMTQNVHHEEDVFGHTLSVLQATKPDLVTRLIALFHDIGKVATRSETPTGIHFYGHEDDGPAIAERIMRELKYPTELIDAVKMGIRYHMRLKQGGDDAVKLSDKALRKFRIELGDRLEQILDVIHADNVSHAGPSALPNQVENVRKRLKALSIQVKKPQLPISGEDLKALGFVPGPVFTKILSAVTEAWFENPNITREEALTIARATINEN